MKRVVVAGSRRLPRGLAPRLLVQFMVALDADDVILLRRAKSGRAGPFESDVAMLASILHLEVEWRIPEPTRRTVGRAATYTRDFAAVEHSDLVLLFIVAPEVMGHSGTGHLQDAALQADRPVYSYSVGLDGTVERIGEYDPDHIYDMLVPAP